MPKTFLPRNAGGGRDAQAQGGDRGLARQSPSPAVDSVPSDAAEMLPLCPSFCQQASSHAFRA